MNPTRLHTKLTHVSTLALSLLLSSCSTSHPARTASHPNLAGHLLIIGGGLDDDNKPVYERFLAIAGSLHNPPRIVIATAASGDEPANAKGKTEAILAYRPDAIISTIGRDTLAPEAVELIDHADAMFFTGGDQKRITTKYLIDKAGAAPGARADYGPEAHAMHRLLGRGGVIAGTSAGDAMMSDPMFFTGRSAEALGIRSTRTAPGADDDADDKRTQTPLGPQIGQGMGFLPWAITDSHFFERHRFGRLVAALEQSGQRLGIGVGEDACVEVNLATGELLGVSVSDALLVDAGAVTRDGLTRRNVRAKVIKQGAVVSLPALLRERTKAPMPASEQCEVEEVEVVEPGQNRQLASWRFFSHAEAAGSTVHIKLDGYEQRAFGDGTGWSTVTISPTASPTTPSPNK